MNFESAWTESKSIVEDVKNDHEVFPDPLIPDDFPGVILLHEEVNKFE